MKNAFFVFTGASLILLAGCATGSKSSRPVVFDGLHPGGPVYRPQEFVVPTPRPTEDPYGTYFEGTDEPAPPEFADPYWVNGYWGWTGRDWEWVRGTWVDRPKPGLLWIHAAALTIGAHTYWKTGYWE